MNADIERRDRSSTDTEERQYQTITRNEFEQRLDNLHREHEVSCRVSSNGFHKELKLTLATPQLYDVSPTTSQRLGPFSVFSLIMNRTIAAGIFAQPVT